MPKKIPGKPEKLSPRNKRAIIRDVRKSVSEIQLPGDINVSHRTIWKTLKNCPNVEYSKGQKAPSWKEHHIKASLEKGTFGLPSTKVTNLTYFFFFFFFFFLCVYFPKQQLRHFHLSKAASLYLASSVSWGCRIH